MNKITLLFLSVFLFLSTSCQNFFFSHQCCQCQEEAPACVEYGLLYNWWAAIGDTDGDNVANTSIANTGWSLPSLTEWETLMDSAGAIEPTSGYIWEDAGSILKAAGFDYWLDSGTPDDYGDDLFNFNARGAGIRSTVFSSIKEQGEYWSSTGGTGGLIDLAWHNQFEHDNDDGSLAYGDKNEGISIRLIKDSLTAAELALANGEYTDPYVGNDGQIYLTVKIGNQVWLAENLMETKFRDGTNIPLVTDATNWSNATSAAYCAYDNDYNNVGCDFTP